MTPSQLIVYLSKVLKESIPISTMIWGAPGIGKSSIVSKAAQDAAVNFIDVRLSQLAPTDLRGLPVPSKPSGRGEIGVSMWYPPEFLPKEGRGILFLDELNMAPPAMQGVAQQLILDRKVGNYTLPNGWLIWAAGNRKEDRSSVFEMPRPLANRFLHLEVEATYDCFKSYALRQNLAEQIIAFLGYRPALLHQSNINEYAWPSPRSWEMASHLLQAGLPIHSAVGVGAAEEFNSYLDVYNRIPNLDLILSGSGQNIQFPKEASCKWATTTALTTRSKQSNEVLHVFHWLIEKGSAEWVQLYASDIVNQFKRRNQLTGLAKVLMEDGTITSHLKEYDQLLKQ